MRIDFKDGGKGKGKYFPVHAVKAYRVRGGIAPHFLTSEQMEVSCGLYGLATLAATRSTQYLFNMTLDGPQSWFGHSGEELNLFLLLLFKHKIIRSVASHYTDYAVPASQLNLTLCRP